jgi:hypothetical protein
MAKRKAITTRYPLPPMATEAKERRLRQWAAKIVSDLPSDGDEARRVLELAEQLRVGWLADSKETVQ